jgi:alpha-1,6-mannosyltransferase
MLSMGVNAQLSPYSKVEESFNMQAMHDLAVMRLNRLADFDHMSFPGVVPRTFIGAAFLVAITTPLQWLLALIRPEGTQSLLDLQCLYRFVLGLISVGTLLYLRRVVTLRFGGRVGAWMVLLFAIGQFHLSFYCSRTLPNTYSLVGCTLAFAFWLLVRI